MSLEGILLRESMQVLAEEGMTPEELDEFRAQTGMDFGSQAASALTALRVLEKWIEIEYAFAVAQARLEGDSWSMIGRTLGISKQAAQQRFGEIATKLAPLFATEDHADNDQFNRLVRKVIVRHYALRLGYSANIYGPADEDEID